MVKICAHFDVGPILKSQQFFCEINGISILLNVTTGGHKYCGNSMEKSEKCNLDRLSDDRDLF